MSAQSAATAKTLTVDSTQLYLSAISSPNSTLSFPPIPPSFPPSKLIPNTRFLIDSFTLLPTPFSASYFLSHFHSDRYSALSPSWFKGIIFCSHLTSLLLIRTLKVPPRFIFPLPLNDPVVVDGCEVILIDANHCPGAVQFLFKVPTKNGIFERTLVRCPCSVLEAWSTCSMCSSFTGFSPSWRVKMARPKLLLCFAIGLGSW